MNDDKELTEKVALLNKAIKKDGIDAVREAVLCFWMGSYEDMGRGDILDEVEKMLKEGYKGTANMTPEELAGEISLDEARIILEDKE
jgi:hypothetical protein